MLGNRKPIMLVIGVAAFITSATTGQCDTIVDDGIDLYIISYVPNRPFDGKATIICELSPFDESVLVYTLIRFDTPAVEEPAVIYLCVHPGEGGKFDLHEITEPWDDTVTWNTRPETGDYVGSFFASRIGWISVDLPRVPEYGWIVKPNDEKGYSCWIWAFESEYRPYLEIVE